MKLDILAIGAHPDDVELGCGGTILKHIGLGYKVGILDLTRGELGTRGSAELRDQEAELAAKIMGVDVRENLRFQDGFFQNDREHQLAIIRILRKYKPDIILSNAHVDRHPDHGRAAKLVSDAVFLSGLPKIQTELDGVPQTKWRPNVVYNYIQAYFTEPDFVMDITGYLDKKMELVKAYGSQFHNPESTEEQTFISTPQFIELVHGRATEYGSISGFQYGEGFTVERRVGVRNLFDLA